MARTATKRLTGMIGAVLWMLALLVIGTGSAVAQGTGGGGSDNDGLLGIGAGLALGLAGVGTGLGQSQAGAAAVGATAENPKNLTKSLIFVALPESILLFGFVGFFLLLGKIG